jgi:hypothetical protein
LERIRETDDKSFAASSNEKQLDMVVRIYGQVRRLDKQLEEWTERLITDPWMYGNEALFKKWRKRLHALLKNLLAHENNLERRNGPVHGEETKNQLLARQAEESFKARDRLRPQRKDGASAAQRRQLMKDKLQKKAKLQAKAGIRSPDTKQLMPNFPSTTVSGSSFLGAGKPSLTRPSWAGSKKDGDYVPWTLFGNS